MAGKKRITDDMFFDEIKSVVALLGHIPSQLEFTKHSTTHCQTVIYRFGSYSKFLSAAGLTRGKHHNRWNRWTRDDLINLLIEFFNKNKRPPTTLDFRQKAGLASPPTYQKMFGSLRKARAAAGIPEPTRIPLRKRITCDDGHIAMSHGEETVDNFLYQSGIDHVSQAFVCTDRQWTCDFLVNGDVWIEVDGFRNGRTGTALAQLIEKLNFYTTHHYHFIVVTPHIEGWEKILLDAIHNST